MGTTREKFHELGDALTYVRGAISEEIAQFVRSTGRSSLGVSVQLRTNGGEEAEITGVYGDGFVRTSNRTRQGDISTEELLLVLDELVRGSYELED